MSVHDEDDNIAKPYVVLTDEKQVRIEPTELSSDSMNGGSGGVRSSVNDLLKWCKCILRSFENGSENVDRVVRHNSPTFDGVISANPHSAAGGDYCLGWCQHRTPAKLGLISPNRTLESPVVGAGCPSLMFYGQQGDIPGYTCNLYIIPESSAAIVVLLNGTGLSDATDWISEHLIQIMYGLQPLVNFVEVASTARSKYLSHYDEDFAAPLEKNRNNDTRLPPLETFRGRYSMDNLSLVTLDVGSADKPGRLSVVINNEWKQVWESWHYHSDVIWYLPENHDLCLLVSLERTHWSSFLISFIRGQYGVVKELELKLDGVVVRFTRDCDDE